MITPNSLSAFSPVNAPSPATRVAATTPARAASADTASKTLQALPQGSTPSRQTPRGSLLDLSV